MESMIEKIQLSLNTNLYSKIQTHLFLSPNPRILKEVGQLLYEGAQINSVDRNNGFKTVLHLAFEEDDEPLADFLLENGARYDIKSGEKGDGPTAFQVYVKRKKAECKCNKRFNIPENSRNAPMDIYEESVGSPSAPMEVDP